MCCIVLRHACYFTFFFALCAVLCCAVLRCTVLCHIVLWHIAVSGKNPRTIGPVHAFLLVFCVLSSCLFFWGQGHQRIRFNETTCLHPRAALRCLPSTVRPSLYPLHSCNIESLFALFNAGDVAGAEGSFWRVFFSRFFPFLRTPVRRDPRPPSVDHQPPSAKHQPLSIMHQALTVDRHPPSVDRQPTSIRSQPRDTKTEGSFFFFFFF